MTRETSKGADEAAIRAVIDAITKAVRMKDVEAMLAHCAPDIVIFDMLPPLTHEGADAIRRNWALALAKFVVPIKYRSTSSTSRSATTSRSPAA